ncbi:Sac phosphatase domain-containing protein [Fimicolochytrium jonesii]|uniref:Sac phosphatase domain-containing protein n=1 Tax=Fimicolochytrium jonesii TaxID=1396493 RepID=UPI0022FDFE67|nr:Sac phosphatase domain-containing protein [Fimicolochytrium jonesii]KAI8816093.1 SacI homology domain-containing protein [Fimicolochytrium jonesii]
MTDRQSIVFVQSHPRTLVLRPAVNLSKTALVFEAIDTGGGGKPARSTARFQPSETIDLAAEGWELLVQRPVYGTAGLVQVGNDLFIGIVTEAIKVGDLEGSPIYRILRVNFYSLLTDRYDANPGEIPDPLKPTNPTYLEESTAGPVIHPCQALIKLLSTGSFYFSPTLDLTRSSQRRAVDVQQGGSPVNIFENADAHFVWNKHLLSGLLQIREQELNAEERDDLDAGGVLVLAIQGYVGMVDFPIGMQPCRMALISRLSCKRAGTRLLSRGVNDDGHVSNFVETEFLLYSKFFTFSFIQIRGSVPVFWEQTGIQMTHKVTISRGAESSAPATRKHFEELVSRYNKIHVVNLLSQKDGSSEQVLGDLFRQSLDRMPDLQELLAYTEFDFHAIVKTGGYDRLNDLTLTMRKPLEGYSYFLADAQSGSIVFSQNGVVRTNCLDCLDRTNVVQTRLARQALATQLAQFDQQFSGMEEENFATLYNNLWADNGDWLSKIYAGTGALKSSFTRKGKSTMLGLLDDAAKSVNRFYINNFQDKTRQEAIDLLLGKLANSETVLLRNPLHEAVSRDMRSRLAEYSSTVPVTMFIGTYNVNGKLKPDSIETWLRSEKVEFPHLVAIGVQELIELTPGQYISADTNKLRLEWEATFMRAINDRPGGVSYVLLRSLHLVALGVFVFVRADSVNLVRHVESSVKKTGLGGMAANKGGIGISFSVNDTSVALVTAHLAAGQTAIDDRNKDYWTIHNGLTFRGRRLAEHDMIFWFGDFNYRINLPNDEIRARVRRHELAYLTTADQLNDQRREGLAFDGFQEGDVSTFDPTYKYDNGTQTYDTSEKARAPAWTDRILYRGRRIDLKEYARGEGLMSDHRPVRAVFEIDTVIIDRTKLDELQKQIYREKMATRHIPPPLPVRPQGPPPKAREEKPSTALLIDLAEDPDPPQQNSIPPSVPTVTAGNGVGFGVGGGTNAPQNAASLGFRDSFPPARPDSFPPAERSTQATSKSLNSLSNSKLPPPSSPSYQWWDKKVDEAFVVREEPILQLSLRLQPESQPTTTHNNNSIPITRSTQITLPSQARASASSAREVRPRKPLRGDERGGKKSA